MFDSNILGIITGMVFFYLMLGLICSVFGEAIAGMLGWRAANMYQGLKDYFFDHGGEALIDKVYQHPLVQGLAGARASAKAAKSGAPKTGKPSEIPLVNFLSALRDTVENLPPSDPKTKTVVDALLGGDKEQAEELWEGAEKNLTNRYRTKMTWLIVGLALVITLASNGDSLLWFNSLWSNKALQESVTRIAAAVAKEGGDNLPKAIDVAKEKVQDLGIFGWSTDPKDPRSVPNSLGGWLSKVVGLIITTVVVARTAPYAFTFFRYAAELMKNKADLLQPPGQR